MQLIGCAFQQLGMVPLGTGGEEQEASSISVFQLPLLGVILAILFMLLNGWQRMYMRQRREQETMEYEVVEEIIYGLESGVLFGMASAISKMGFVFLEQGFHPILLPMCVLISTSCSGTGFYYQTQGLKHGRAIVVSTCATIASIVMGVVAGMLALGERLPSAPSARLLLLVGWIFIMMGIILLVTSSRLLRKLPRPLRRFLRAGIDRPSRNASFQDVNPSTVIHAVTLHHLLPSSAKEKA